VLQLTQAVPRLSIAGSAESVQAAYRDYQELSLAKGSLKRMYTLTLTLALLLAVHRHGAGLPAGAPAPRRCRSSPAAPRRWRPAIIRRAKPSPAATNWAC
jgi:hypothetical protein